MTWFRNKKEAQDTIRENLPFLVEFGRESSVFSDDEKWGWSTPFSGTSGQNKKLANAAAKNPFAYAAITLICDTISELPIITLDAAGERSDSNPLLDLINRPNADQTWREILWLQTYNLEITGKQFWGATGPSGTFGTQVPSFEPYALWALPADKMRVHMDDVLFGKVLYYEYTPGGSHSKKELNPWEVQHIFYQDPFDAEQSISPTLAAYKSIKLIDVLNAKLAQMVDNDGATKVLFTPKGEPVSVRDSPNIEADIKRLGKISRAMAYLNTEMDVHNLGIKPFETGSADLKSDARMEIAAALRVPPMFMGIMEHATLSNYTQAERSLYEHTILPIGRMIFDGLNHWLSEKKGGYTLAIDLNAIDALKESANDLTDRQAKQVATGIKTINEVRDDNGDDANTSGDVLLVPATLEPLGQSTGELDYNDPDTEV